MMEYSEFLEKTNTNLKNAKYRISTVEKLPDSAQIDLLASKTYFSWKGFVILSQHFLISYIENPTLQDEQDLFDHGFKLGKKINRIPLLRGMQFGYMIIPIIVTKNVEESLLSYVTNTPRKHFSIFEFPVIVDLEKNQIHYFKKTAIWGALFFSDMRKTVSKYIENVLLSS
ncbi:MAG: hypothetical protein MUP98_06840 [Candidatus Aminicenantes bacterium]|nr:hypothetical protein [Candidatus Aminicenantes bacterium]